MESLGDAGRLFTRGALAVSRPERLNPFPLDKPHYHYHHHREPPETLQGQRYCTIPIPPMVRAAA